MKESEAKLKWCPMSRVVIDSPGYAAGNRFQDGPRYDAQCLCVGSACMMWEPFPEVKNNSFVRDSAGGFVYKDNGDCALKSQELHCNGA